jgi:predicted dehydrogenase
MINVGVIGYGYWGPNLVRNFMETPGSTVSMVSDLRPERLKSITTRYPTIGTTVNFKDLLNNPDINLVAIATPVSTHFDIALESLKAGKHVLLEKPLTSTSAQARSLIQEAQKQNRTLAVDHTFVYTGAVRKMRDLIQKNELGELYYYDSVRINLGLFQHDVSVVWDLAVHDLSIMDFILPYHPVAVSATGMAHLHGQPEDVAYLTLYYENSFIAHLHVNWLAPVKVRRSLLSGSQKMIVYDDLEPSEKIKIYDKGVVLEDKPESIYKMMVGYRTGDMWSPQLDGSEALKVEVQHLIKCIEGTECLVTDGEAGMRVVRILEAATESLAAHGQPIDL